MKTYRIKEPRCWVVRWKRDPYNIDHSTDYVGYVSLCPKSDAKEYKSVEEARVDVESAGLSWDVWRIVRRGKVSK